MLWVLQGLRYRLPLSPNSKKKMFGTNKCHVAKANGEKKKIVIQMRTGK